MNPNRSILIVGWDIKLIKEILLPISERSDIDFIFFSHEKDYHSLSDLGVKSNFTYNLPKGTEEVDFDFLSSLESNSGTTLNNIILGDRVMREIDIFDAYRYAENLARSILDVIVRENPLFVLGSWDATIQGVSMLCAKKQSLNFITAKFSVIPHSYLAFCTYPNNHQELDYACNDRDQVRVLATEKYEDWISGNVEAPVYVSAKTLLDIIERIPLYTRRVFINLNQYLRFGRNKYLYFSILRLTRQFVRKKTNIVLMKKGILLTKIPDSDYAFYGLHMQPESTVDVMAPFQSNQFELIRSISRSLPCNIPLLVKIHISDADNYSKADIKQLQLIPNVQVVSPFVSSREFINKARLLFSIQGTIALEGALLGKPVIMFGRSSYAIFDSVKFCETMDELPLLVEKQLNVGTVDKKQIIDNYTSLLMNYLPACSDDWQVSLSGGLSDKEILNFECIFERLVSYLGKI